MPPAADERTLLTLFADVHYFISPPTQRPPHHRFEKASYFYLYHSQSTQTARIEIANNPGTPHQDAFTGALPGATLTHSFKQPSLVTLTVATRAQNPDAARGEASSAALWQLKDFNADRGVEYLYLLSAVDVYFWTERDAERFVEAVTSLGSGGVAGLDVRAKPQPQSQPQQPQQAQQAQLSPVVAKLEQAAITPAYGHASQQRDSVSTIASAQQPAASLPGPPPRQPYPHSASPASTNTPPPAPLSYNPAAPAAPEPIAHREKTPPPPDVSSSGTGLSGMAGRQEEPQFSPPPRTATTNSLYAAPTPPALAPGQRANSLPFAGYAAPPGSPGVVPGSPPAYGQGQGQGYGQQGQGFPQGGYTPSPPPGQYQQPQQQQGGYSGHAPDASAIHSTAYRPSEAELAAQAKGGAGGSAKGGRFDRGVDRFLKKLDKSWG